MKKTSALVLLLVLLCAAGTIFARGKKDKAPADPAAEAPSRPVEVSGVVRMVGSSPMTSLVISGEEHDWYIAPEEEGKLAEFQQQSVTVRAQEYYYDRVFANGTSAGRQYYLKDIVIIAP